MFKRTAVLTGLLVSAATLLQAAPAKGTVVSVKDRTIVMKVEGEKASWMKKGTPVKINKKINGKIAEVADATLTITSPKAGELKAGESVTFEKSLAASGC